MSFSNHLRLADALLPAVLAAGRIEMHHFAAGVIVETKLDASPVTVAVMVALCATLGVLQYRWIGEASRAERDRMKAGLESRLQRLSRSRAGWTRCRWCRRRCS